METCYNNPTRDSLLLLKERIIKAEILLNKYACLSKKCSDLEVSHSQAVENEKRAKKDAAKYLEKYCKLTKKCNCLTSKINTLEETIKGKVNELEEYQNEFAKLESVIQVYKTERKGHQSLKRDKDFLLTHLWKILKQSEEGAKDSKIRKLGEIFFKKFEKELAELKLEDFRKLQQKNNSKLPEFHKTTEVMCSSPDPQLIDSDESDSMETDSLPAVENLPALNSSCTTEGVTNPCRNSSSVDKQSCISNTSVEETNVLKNDPATAIERSISEGKENVRKIKVKENHKIVKDSKGVDNSGFNSNKNGHSNGSSINLDISLSPNATYSSPGAVEEKCGSEVASHKDLDVKKELTSERDAKEKTRGKFNRTYLNRKFTNLSQNERCSSDASDKPNFTSHSDSQSKLETVSEGTNSFTLPDLDCSNSSSEVISLDIDDKAGDLKNLPEHDRFYEKMFNSVTDFESQSDLMDSNSENSTSLLFLMENNLTNVETDFSAESNKETCSKSTRNFSIFDVQDSEDTVKDSVETPEEPQGTCVEFTSDNRNMIDLNEDSINEKCINQDGVNPHGASCEEKNMVTVQNDKPEDNSNLTERLPRNDTGPEDRFASDTFQNRLVNSDSNDSISDEEIFRILKSVAPVRLLSPIKEKEPNVRDELENRQSLSQEKNSVIAEDTQPKNSTSNSNENMTNGKQGNCTEEPLKTIGNVLLETKKMADKYVQTVEPSRDDKGCQKSGRIQKTVLSKSVIRKICNIIWKRNLKLTCGNHFASYVKSHSSCFAILKAMFGMFKCHKLQNCTRTEEKLKNLLDKGKSRSRNRIQLLRKKSYWEVNDVEVAEVNGDKIEDSFELDCSTDKANEFLTHVPNFHSSDDAVVNNFMMPAKEIRVPESKSLVWLTPRQELSFGNHQKSVQLNVDEKVCEGTFAWEQKIDADIHFERDVKADSFKKENEGFLKAGTDVKCLGSDLYAKTESCGIVEENVINVEYDALKPESKHFESCREAGKDENDRGKELEGTEKPLLRRSPRLQNRNVLVSVKNTFINEPSVISPPETKSDSDSNRIDSKISSNESGSSQNLKQKFEDLFGEAEEELQFEVPEHGKEPENVPAEAPERHAKGSTAKAISVDLQTDNKKHAVIKRSKPGSCHINTQKTTGIPKCKRPNLTVPEESKGESNEIDEGCKTSDGMGLLDSIMDAMTKQTEEFKVKPPPREAEITNSGECGSNVRTVAYPVKDPSVETRVQNKISKEYEMKGNDSAFLNLSHYWGLESNPGNHFIKENSKFTQVPRRSLAEEKKMRNLVQKEISNFVQMDIGSVEEGQEKVKSCITVLQKAGEDTVANAIVSEIMANVDEELQKFDRPAPPLTRTQHRIMIILACLGKSSEQHNGISYKILKIIWSKLFPENFFWPDDSVEMASRFYAALCKRLNNFKGMWKFCFKAVSCMRQRWCLPIFVVLQVWPDILHNAHEIQENILVNAFVNVILHSPKTEEMRRKRQEQKLLAIKHLLINFYNFDCNSTIEGFTQQLIESHLQNVPGSSDALVLVSKCRKWEWTRKNVLGKLLETLDAWSSGAVPDETGLKTLDVIHQTASVFPGPESPMAPFVEDVISKFSKILNSENLKPSSEEKVIRILCCLCHYSSVKDILSRVSGKYPSDCVIYSEIKRAVNSSNRKAKGRGASAKGKKNTKWNKARKNFKKKGKRKTKKKSSSQKKVVEMSKASEQT